MVGANYLPEQMLPEHWDYNSGNYFLNMTFLPCLEIGYRCTLMKLKTGKWNQDRSVSLRLRPLKEGKYWPSVVVGSNDALTTGQLNTFSEVTGNRYFRRCMGWRRSTFSLAVMTWRLHLDGISRSVRMPFVTACSAE